MAGMSNDLYGGPAWDGEVHLDSQIVIEMHRFQDLDDPVGVWSPALLKMTTWLLLLEAYEKEGGFFVWIKRSINRPGKMPVSTFGDLIQ